MSEVTLRDLINTQGAALTVGQKASLYELLVKGTRMETRTALSRRLDLSLCLWPCYPIFERVYFEGNKASYCAGQDYRAEIPYVRNLILGKAK